MYNGEVKKDLVEHLANTVKELGNRVGIDEDLGNITKGELLMFLMYLAASDGDISWEEARYIGDVVGFYGTPSQIGRAIREKNLYSTEFENRVPVCLQVMIKLDELLKDSHDVIAGKASRSVIQTFHTVGAELIKLNSSVHVNSERDLRIYLHMMEEYRDSHLGLNLDAMGFTKDSPGDAFGFKKN